MDTIENNKRNVYIYKSDICLPFAFYKSSSSIFRILNNILNFNDIENRWPKYKEILKRNNIDESNYKIVLSDLSNGCAYAFIADALVESFFRNNNNKYDDKKFKDIFGISIKLNDFAIDNTLLALDMFCKLYNLSRFIISEFDVREYNSYQEAVKDLFNLDSSSEGDANITLCNNGYNGLGIQQEGNSKGKIKIKSEKPKNQYQMIGTYDDLAKKFLNGKEFVSTEELRKDLSEKGILFTVHETDMDSKLSGIIGEINSFWVNYYLEKNDSELQIECEIKNYDDFIEFMSNEEITNFVVGVRSWPDSKAVCKDLDNTIDGTKMSDKKIGHIIALDSIDTFGNIIVERQNKKFIIDKKYASGLDFKIISVKGFTKDKGKLSSK